MSGLLYVIDKLGSTLADAEQELAALRQRIAVLEQQLAAKADEPPAAS